LYYLWIFKPTSLLQAFTWVLFGWLTVDDLDAVYREIEAAHWSCKVMEFCRTIFQAWKVIENSKGRGKSSKALENMIMSLNFYNCTEKFCSRTANEVVLYRLL